MRMAHPSFSAGKRLGEPRTDGVQLRPSLRQGNARLQPSGDLKPVPRPSGHPAAEERVLGEGDPDLLAFGETGKAKRRGHDPDHREGALVQVDGACDDARDRLQTSRATGSR